MPTCASPASAADRCANCAPGELAPDLCQRLEATDDKWQRVFEVALGRNHLDAA
jgi:hypothetical protein